MQSAYFPLFAEEEERGENKPSSVSITHCDVVTRLLISHLNARNYSKKWDRVYRWSPGITFSHMKGFKTDPQECARGATIRAVRGMLITCLHFGWGIHIIWTINLACVNSLQCLRKEMMMFLEYLGWPEQKQFCKYLKITNPFLKAGQMKKVSANRRKKTKSDTIAYTAELVDVIKILRWHNFCQVAFLEKKN